MPHEWFVGLGQLPLLALTSLAAAVLIKGADWLVEGASGLAFRLGISPVIVGATIVSLGTTSPEAGVSVMAAWSGQSGLALGNAIGSIIADTGLIFGIGCLLAVLPADRFVLSRQGWVQFGAGVLLAALCYGAFLMDGDAARLERRVGFLLVGLLVVYLYASVQWSRRHPRGAAVEGVRVARSIPALIAFGIVGIALVLLSSRSMILSVSELAEAHWHVPQVVIAATVVALGTSLPELVIGVTSIVKGHTEILVGNIIGADILNVLFVVGASAVAAPLPLVEPGATVPRIGLYLHIPTMLLILLLFRIFVFSAAKRGSFRRWYGVPLVLIYVVYIVAQYLVS